MRNKVLILSLLSLTAFGLTGCDSKPVVVNVENSEALNGTNIGKSTLFMIGDGLCYDSTTRIVYWWNGFWEIPFSPYYAPNGLPYKYNPETNTFEEIWNT